MPTNRLERTKIHVSPNAGDVVFFEFRDANLAVNKVFSYGEPHSNRADFPRHRLVFVSQKDEEDRQRWYYAADREDQESHNWRVSYPYAGLTTAPRFSCFFILPREGYEPIPKGTVHPLDSGEKTPARHMRFRRSRLIFERQVDTGFEEIDSLYIAVERVYDRLPAQAEQLALNVERSYPHGGLLDFPRYTRTLIVPKQDLPEFQPGAPDPVYAAARLIHREQVGIDDEMLRSLYTVVRSVYDTPPSISAQEGYNAETEYPYYADKRFPRTVRKYLVPRSAAGAETIPSAGLDLGGAALSYRKVDRMEGSPEDSYYVLVTVAHDKVPDASDAGDAAFLAGFGWRLSRPYGTDEHPRIEWRVPSVKAGFEPSPDYSPCPIGGYSQLLLTGEDAEADKDHLDQVNLMRVYDSLPGPLFEEETRDLVADIPEGFVTARTVERFRQPVSSPSTIGDTGGNPLDAGGAIVQTKLGESGSNKLVLETSSTRLTVEVGPMESVEYDEETGRVYSVTQEIVAAGTPGKGLDPATGEFSTVRPINQMFSVKTTRKATTLGIGTESQTYGSIVNYSWPPVLQEIQFFVVERRGKVLDRYGYHVKMKEGYSGPCRATVMEAWRATPFTPPNVTAMRPTSMFFDFPMTRNFSIGACLHRSFTFTETVGTSHPVLAPATTTITFDATNFTDWPMAIVAHYQQTPYRGGYRSKSIMVHKPE